jgi:inositol 1,4,5-triphosphate receptor type 1/inositol 1,4,5-triphosphate receptor type 3
MHKNKINKLYGSKEGGYNQHIKLDHYYWNYLFFIMTLLKMKQKDMNEIENEIYNNYINQNFGWIPFERY